MRHLKLLGVAAVMAATVIIGTGTAGAAPKPDPYTTITVTCAGIAEPFTVTTAGGGNSNWTPAFVGHATYVPISFGAFSGTGPDGPFVDPARTQNANKGGSNARLDCTYTIDTPPGPFHFEGTGSVVVAVVGKA
jgi:hypothetical protein